MAAKLDYSRLLDDEFLNRRPERVRARVVTRGAADVLGASTDLWSSVAPARCLECLCGAAMAAAVLVSIVFVVLLVHAHQQGVGRLHESLAMPLFGQARVPGNGPQPNRTTPSLWDRVHALNHTDGEVALSHGGLQLLSIVQQQGSLHDHEHDHGHDHEMHGVAEETEHHVAMSGGFEAHDDDHHDDDHDNGVHDHAHPGDLVLEDHHIVPAGDPDPTDSTLLLCLPSKPTDKPVSTPAAPSGANATNATDVGAPDFPLHLSRAQRDVVHSVVEYLSGVAQCHVIVLRGVGEDRGVEESVSNNRRQALPVFHGHTGCGFSSDEDDDDEVAAEAGGNLVLPSGRSLPVVLWDAEQLFSRSPLAADWRGLRQRRARGSSSRASVTASDTASPTGTDLLELSARLQLLWRYGGLTADLHSSADQVLKTLSVLNRSDTSHVYLETTRAVLLAAPQTCNAVVFDLITAITKQAKTDPGPSAAVHSDGDVQVFDGVLNAYCRGRQRRTRSLSDGQVDSTTTKKPSRSSTTAAPSTTPTSAPSSTPDPSPPKTRPPHSRKTFRMLRAGPTVAPTTPEPLEVRVDTTQCKGNLVAITLP